VFVGCYQALGRPLPLGYYPSRKEAVANFFEMSVIIQKFTELNYAQRHTEHL
jgi:hypothetical protein